MRILITGGSGFIGSHATRHLAAKGHEITILDLEEPILPADVTFIEGDIRDATMVAEAMEGQEAVIHLAALVSAPESVEKPEETAAINVDGSRNVIAAAEKAGVKRLILASSAAVYGLQPRTPTKETEPFDPLTPYATTKIAMEQLRTSIPRVNLRFFNVYGPGQNPESHYAAVIPLFLKRAKANEPLTIYGDGSQTRDFIDVTDVCRAIETALTRGEGSYNIATGKAISIKELAEMIIKMTGSKSERAYAEPRAGDPAASLADVTKAKEELGFEAEITLEEGLKRMAGEED